MEGESGRVGGEKKKEDPGGGASRVEGVGWWRGEKSRVWVCCGWAVTGRRAGWWAGGFGWASLLS
jgi:hypothetical protein